MKEWLKVRRAKLPRTGKTGFMPLPVLLEIIGRAADLDELRGDFVARAGKHFGAARAAIFLLDQVPLGALENSRHPLAAYVAEHHAPMSSDALPTRALVRRSDHGHALLGPLIYDGQLQGVLAFTRHVSDAAFEASDIADVTALCLHVSAFLASRAIAARPELPALTARERQICELVALGHTNAQIAQALCVSPETVKAHLKTIFRKWEINSRAGLVGLWSRWTIATVSIAG